MRYFFVPRQRAQQHGYSQVAQQMSTTSTTELREMGLKFMERLKAAWSDHLLCMSMIADTLMYLDRVYCTDKHVQPVLPATLQLFRDCVLYSRTASEEAGYENMLAVLINIMLSQIQMDEVSSSAASRLLMWSRTLRG